MEFDDVDEADEKLDNIADGQLYRLRRGAAYRPSHASSGRGGHSNSNINRGGHRGSPITTRGSPSRGPLSRGGRGDISSGVDRGGRIARSGDARHDMPSRYAISS